MTKSAELREMADAAYGCGDWLAGAEYMRLSRLAAEQEDLEYEEHRWLPEVAVDDHSHHTTFQEPEGPEPEPTDDDPERGRGQP
jgi:hypothetical protein